MKKPTYVPHLSVYLWSTQFTHCKKVLDIGCGEGYGMLITSMFAREVKGLDISPRGIKVSRLHKYFCPVTSEIFNLEKQKIEENFDVVVAFEVLEHIENPKEVMAQLREKAKMVIFSVPHAYPHRLHKTDYYSLDDVKKLTEGFDVKWFYLSGTNIVEDVPEKIDRYIGIATPV